MAAIQSSTIGGITNQTITSTGSGSQAQQAFATQQDAAARQNAANQMAKGGSKYRGGAIALAPMQAGTSPAQVALNAQVQSTGAQTFKNGEYDNAVNKTTTTTTTTATKGGRRRRTRKTRTNKRKTRRNHKKSKRRRTKGSRK